MIRCMLEIHDNVLIAAMGQSVAERRYALLLIVFLVCNKTPEEVRKNMERELRQAIKSKVKNQVMDGLLAANPIEVPKALLSNEVDRLRVQAVQQFGGNIKPDQLPAELFEEQAKRRVVLGLIVAEVVKQFDLKPDEDRVREMIQEMASAYQEPEQVVAWYYKNDQQLNEVRSVVLEEQVVDTVLQKAKVTDKAVS